jgi:hypothetical protein
MVMIYINGVAMPAPTSYDVKLADIDSSNSGRGETGYLTRERLRADVASINVGWENITTNELNTIMNAIKNPEFSVRFFKGGEYKDADMYAGDRALELTFPVEGDERWSLSFPLTEL